VDCINNNSDYQPPRTTRSSNYGNRINDNVTWQFSRHEID